MMRNKKIEENSSENNLIQMMVVSLFIILLAFFILLNSIAKDSEERKLLALGSLSKSFNMLAGGDSMIESYGDKESSTDFVNLKNEYIDFSGLVIGGDNLVQQVQFMQTARGSLLRIPARLLFYDKSMEINPKSHAFLNNLIKVILQNEYPVEIVGHTDIEQIDKIGVISNRQFSVIRSLKVLRYLLDKSKIAAKRFTVFGWGEYRPAVYGKNMESRDLNNRIEILFVHKKTRKKPKGVFIFKDFLFDAFEKNE